MIPPNNGATDAPGLFSQIRRFFGGRWPFLRFREQREQKVDRSRNGTTDHGHLYDGRGNYITGKPTGPEDETVFGMNGKAPVPAFAIPDRLVARAVMMARAAALHSQPLTDIARMIADAFGRHYGVFRDRFLSEIRFLEDSIRRCEDERARVTRERDARPLVVVRIDELSWPSGLKTVGIILLLAVWIMTVTADVYNAARHVQPFIPNQSWLWAFISVSLVASMIVGIDVLLVSLSVSRASGQVRVAGAVIVMALGLLWAALFAVNFGAVFSDEFTPLSLGWQRFLLSAQILAGIGFGVVVLNGAVSLFDRVERVLPDPVRVELDAELEALSERIRPLAAKLGDVQGHYRELQACENFLRHAAEQAFVTAQTEVELIAAEHEIERRFLENRRRLLLGGPLNNDPSNN